MWRVKLVAERHPDVVTETELACIERDEAVGLAKPGLRLDEAKRLAAALQAGMALARMAVLGECPRACKACGRRLAAKGHHGATFRSLFGDVPVRRVFVCPCQDGRGEAKGVAAPDFGGDAVAPELACVTARYAALAPFRKVAAPLSELLPLGGAQHVRTVRNRTLRVGAEVVQAHAAEVAGRPAAQAAVPVVVGLDGGHVRDRHRSDGGRSEVVAGKQAAGLLGYLGRNEAAPVPHAARRRRGEPIATSFMESAVDEVIAWRTAKKQQMRWNRVTVPFLLDVRTAVPNGTLEHAFRRCYAGFRPVNDDRRPTAASA